MIPINYTIAKYWLTLPHYKQHVFVILLQIYVIFKNFVDVKKHIGLSTEWWQQLQNKTLCALSTAPVKVLKWIEPLGWLGTAQHQFLFNLISYHNILCYMFFMWRVKWGWSQMQRGWWPRKIGDGSWAKHMSCTNVFTNTFRDIFVNLMTNIFTAKSESNF